VGQILLPAAAMSYYPYWLNLSHQTALNLTPVNLQVVENLAGEENFPEFHQIVVKNPFVVVDFKILVQYLIDPSCRDTKAICIAK
jgi:hypothetical protein